MHESSWPMPIQVRPTKQARCIVGYIRLDHLELADAEQHLAEPPGSFHGVGEVFALAAHSDDLKFTRPENLLILVLADGAINASEGSGIGHR